MGIMAADVSPPSPLPRFPGGAGRRAADRQRSRAQEGRGSDTSLGWPAYFHPRGAAGRRRHRRGRRAAARGSSARRRGVRGPFLLAGARQRSRPHHRDGAGARDPAGRTGHPRTHFHGRAGRRHSRAARRAFGAAPLRALRADRPRDPQPPDLCRRHPGGTAPAARSPDRTLRRAQPAHDLDRSDLGDGGERAGYISSIATIDAMGARARKEPELLMPAVAGAVLSSIATIVQLAILIAATSMETLKVFYLPLVFSGAAALLYGGVFTLWALRTHSRGP